MCCIAELGFDEELFRTVAASGVGIVGIDLFEWVAIKANIIQTTIWALISPEFERRARCKVIVTERCHCTERTLVSKGPAEQADSARIPTRKIIDNHTLVGMIKKEPSSANEFSRCANWWNVLISSGGGGSSGNKLAMTNCRTKNRKELVQQKGQ